MEGLINLPLFVISSIIIIIAPGPDFIYVTTRGVAEGNKAGIMSAFGISAGLLVHTLFAALGLSTIIQSSRIVYLIIKYIGAGYLFFLGVKMLITKSKLSDVQPPLKRSGVFKQGLLTNVFNPKAIITFMAFLPQFVDSKIPNPGVHFIYLGIAFSSLALLWFGTIGYFAGLIGDVIKRSKIFQSAIQYVGGTMMILLGLRLALKKE
jgi:threonine/homoserine/homoserine lactone efflux protein